MAHLSRSQIEFKDPLGYKIFLETRKGWIYDYIKLNQITNITNTVKIIERIQHTLSEPMKIQGSVIRTSCGIEIGVYVLDESLQTAEIIN